MTLRGGILLPLAVCICLTAVVAREALIGSDGTAGVDLAEGSRPPSAARASLTSDRLPPLSSFEPFVARPPFSESRRPPLDTSSGVGDRPPFELVGLIITPSQSHALFMRPGMPRCDRIEEGQSIDGWTLEQILPDRVVLRGPRRRHEMKIGPESSRPQSAAAPPPSQMLIPTGSGGLPARLSPKDTRWMAR